MFFPTHPFTYTPHVFTYVFSKNLYFWTASYAVLKFIVLFNSFLSENFLVYQPSCLLNFPYDKFPVCHIFWWKLSCLSGLSVWYLSCMSAFLSGNFPAYQIPFRWIFCSPNFLSENLPVYYTSCLMIFLSTCLHFCCPIYGLSTCLPICMSVCLQIYNPTHFFVCLPAYLHVDTLPFPSLSARLLPVPPVFTTTSLDGCLSV